MRGADAITISRIALVVPIVYLVVLKANPMAPAILLLVAMALDGLDGFAALRSASKGSLSLLDYLKYALGNRKYAKKIGDLKASIGKAASYGPRFDVAGDRITEYSLWGLFTYVHIVPLFVLIIIIVRNSMADALMGAKGTSSKMKTRFANILYSNRMASFISIFLKFVTFSYLMFVYVLNYPVWVGYALIAVLVVYIVARGAAEVYESLA
jgi:phosphatidylglycerophosphate synthase